MADDRDWRYQRAVARVEVAVEEIVAELTRPSYEGRPVQRREILPPRPLPGIVWSIDGELVVEFVYRDSVPDQLLVHDIALLHTLKRRFQHTDTSRLRT